MHIRWLMVVLLTLAAASANAQASKIQQSDDAVVGVGAEGQAVWKIRHAFDGGFKELPFEPIIDARHAYYAVRSDLLTVDLDTGKVLDRRRFPSYIEAMTRNGEDYQIELAPSDETGDNFKPLRVAYSPDSPAPGRGVIRPISVWTARKDADHLARTEPGVALDELSTEKAAEIVDELTAQEERDPTNTFLPLYRGRILQGQGQDELAHQAFVQATRVENTHWSDDIVVSSHLTKYGADALADTVFERGRQGMLDAGVRAERMHGLILQVLLFTPLKDVIERAIADEDYERVDRLSGRIATIFPHIEMGQVAWTTLADWFDAEGQPELATKWRDRAREASSSRIGNLAYSGAREMDMALVFLLGGLLALFLIPFAIGLRSPHTPSDTPRHETSPDESSPRSIFPRPNIGPLEVVGVALMVVLCVQLAQFAQQRVIAVGEAVSAPLELYHDAYGTPKFVDWLEKFEASEERDAWLEYAEAELAATKKGTRADGNPPSEAALADVLLDADLADGVGAMPVQFPGSHFLSATHWLRLAFSFGLAAAAGLVFGLLFRRFLPVGARRLSMAVPGSARSVGPFGVAICAAFFAAVLALLFDFDRLLTTFAVPSFGRYFGLDGLSDFEPSRMWSYAALAASLAAHAATVWWSERADKSST